jgi:hypothetical protein
MILCKVHSPAPHLGACSQVSSFGCGSPVSSWRLFLAPAPGPLSFSPTAWVATVSPTLRYSSYDAHVYPLFIILAPVPKQVFSAADPQYPVGTCPWSRHMLSFSPTAWAATVSPTLKDTCAAHILCIFCVFKLLFPGKNFWLQIFFSTKLSWRLLLAPAPAPLSFSPTAWSATSSPTQRYGPIVMFIPLRFICSQASIFDCRSPVSSWRLFLARLAYSKVRLCCACVVNSL